MLIDVWFHGFSEFDLVSFGSIFDRVGNTMIKFVSFLCVCIKDAFFLLLLTIELISLGRYS